MRAAVSGQRSAVSRRRGARYSVLGTGYSSLVTRHSSLHRGGVTLVEVLMSVLLTGFGVITLATLFPISVMRTVQATHLTHGTVLRYNAEAQIELFPSLVYDPDNDGDTAEHANSIYVVDPLGAFVVGGNFGNGGAAALPRFNGGLPNEPAARSFVTLPDSFVPQVEDTPTSFTPTSATMPAAVSLANIPDKNWPPPPSRIVLFDDTGRGSQMREIDTITGQTVSWDPLKPLPAGYNVEKARIVTPESRYTWLLTVRNLPGQSAATANVAVVVFFNRPLALEDEQVFAASFIQGGPQVNVGWAGNKPHITEGGHVFDVENGYWYQIQQVQESGSTAALTLDRPATASSNSAIFMRNIVEVFPIGTK
ncbi:MAG: hypothetical protein WED34_13360 [Planctomycetales bacterium]